MLSTLRVKKIVALLLFFVSTFSYGLVFAETGQVSYDSSVSMTSAAADRTAAAAQARLQAAQSAFNAASTNRRTVNANPNATPAEKQAAEAAFITAQQNLAAAQSENTAAQSSAASASSTLAQTKKTSDGACSSFLDTFSVECMISAVSYVIAHTLGTLVLGIFTFFLGLAGIIFEYAVWFSIIKFPDLLRITTGSGIYDSWVVIRNLFNIIIVFELLKIAIYKIAGNFFSDGKKPRELKQLLMSVIIFTLFVNFSFFFTKALIDISNVVALQFYGALGGKGDNSFVQGNIGFGIAQSMGVTDSAYRTEKAESIGKDGTGGGLSEASSKGILGKGEIREHLADSITGVILLMIIITIACFVLLQGASIFVGRSVYLLLIVVLSPLMFAKGIVGFVEKWSEQWWKYLLEQLFVAPVYLGMLFIALKVIGGNSNTGLLSVFSVAQNPGGGLLAYMLSIVPMLMQAAIVGALFIAVVRVSKDFASNTAGRSMAYGNKVFAGGLGYAGRKSIGRLSNRLSNSARLKDWAARGGVSGRLAENVLGSSAYLGTKATFDYRNAPLQKLERLGGSKFKFDGLDGGSKVGFTGERAEADKKRTDTFNAKKSGREALLNEDTYGMSEEQKKAADQRNRDRLERFQTNQSRPYFGTKTEKEIAELLGESKGLLNESADINNLQKLADKAEQELRDAKSTRDPEKIKAAEDTFKAAKDKLDESVKASNEGLENFKSMLKDENSSFQKDDETKKEVGKFLKLLQDTEGLTGEQLRGAVRKNLQTLEDFKRSQETTMGVSNNTINSTWRRAGAMSSGIRSTLTGQDGSYRQENEWQKAAENTRKANMRDQTLKKAESILKDITFKENGADLSIPKTKDEVKEILKKKIKETTNPSEQAHFRAAMRNLDKYHKKISEEADSQPK